MALALRSIMCTVFFPVTATVSLPLWPLGDSRLLYVQRASLCSGEDTHTLGEVCALEIPATPRMMPPPTANPTMLEVSSPAQHTW